MHRNFDWVIAIPTYDRVAILQRKALNWLRDILLPMHLVHVFVDAQEPEQSFRAYQHLEKEYGVSVRRGGAGIHSQRNFIMESFPVGQQILEIDDDIEGLDYCTSPTYKVKGTKCNPVPTKSVADLIDELFRIADAQNCKLWGVYCLRNPYYMSHTITIGRSAKST